MYCRRRNPGQPASRAAFHREQYFKSAQQMQELFADVPSALANTVEIAKRCSLTLVLGKPQLPAFPTPNGMPAEEYFPLPRLKVWKSASSTCIRTRHGATKNGRVTSSAWSLSWAPSSRWGSRVLSHCG